MKEWVKVTRSAQGVTVVTVTVQDGCLVARYSARTVLTGIKAGYLEARNHAHSHLAELREALTELEAAA